MLFMYCVVSQSDCEWVNGDGDKYSKSAYDFRAVNDYTPLFYPITFDHDVSLSSSQPVTIGITNDWVRFEMCPMLG